MSDYLFRGSLKDLDPDVYELTQLEAERQARAEGLDVLGIVHSHPDHPAEPSSFDLEHAWPYYSYMIVSVSGGAAADQRSWRLRDDRSGFDPERLEFTPGAATPVAGA